MSDPAEDAALLDAKRRHERHPCGHTDAEHNDWKAAAADCDGRPPSPAVKAIQQEDAIGAVIKACDRIGVAVKTCETYTLELVLELVKTELRRRRTP